MRKGSPQWSSHQSNESLHIPVCVRLRAPSTGLEWAVQLFLQHCPGCARTSDRCWGQNAGNLRRGKMHFGRTRQVRICTVRIQRKKIIASVVENINSGCWEYFNSKSKNDSNMTVKMYILTWYFAFKWAICFIENLLILNWTAYFTLKWFLLPYRLVGGGWGMSAGRDGQRTLILGNFRTCCCFGSGTSDALNVWEKRPIPLISGKLVPKLVRPCRSLRSWKLGSFPEAIKALSGGEGHSTFSPDWHRWPIPGKTATLWCKSGNKAKLHSCDYYNYIVECTK